MYKLLQEFCSILHLLSFYSRMLPLTDLLLEKLTVEKTLFRTMVISSLLLCLLVLLIQQCLKVFDICYGYYVNCQRLRSFPQPPHSSWFLGHVGMVSVASIRNGKMPTSKHLHKEIWNASHRCFSYIIPQPWGLWQTEPQGYYIFQFQQKEYSQNKNCWKANCWIERNYGFLKEHSITQKDGCDQLHIKKKTTSYLCTHDFSRHWCHWKNKQIRTGVFGSCSRSIQTWKWGRWREGGKSTRMDGGVFKKALLCILPLSSSYIGWATCMARLLIVVAQKSPGGIVVSGHSAGCPLPGVWSWSVQGWLSLPPFQGW